MQHKRPTTSTDQVVGRSSWRPTLSGHVRLSTATRALAYLHPSTWPRTATDRRSGRAVADLARWNSWHPVDLVQPSHALPRGQQVTELPAEHARLAPGCRSRTLRGVASRRPGRAWPCASLGGGLDGRRF